MKLPKLNLSSNKNLSVEKRQAGFLADLDKVMKKWGMSIGAQVFAQDGYVSPIPPVAPQQDIKETINR